MSHDLAKTLTYLAIHLTIGFSVAYLLTGSVAIAGGIALIEPCANAVAFFFHERAWRGDYAAFVRRWFGRDDLRAATDV
ncbi:MULTISPECIES: DUF2061 domain-containing protein [unclassified Sphingomonas]|jgi:uncharacterized membrane protein|uniref:DUF2061 domain-containing protein n=1 Tax=unclassified Sphingomonas TaxID=196159 RepID=UPI00082A91CA|nr:MULTISPECIES: DUF2061 domain-containing protein [unclassified Sphingomonas]